jgi:hypothetical protein
MQVLCLSVRGCYIDNVRGGEVRRPSRFGGERASLLRIR